MANVHGGLINNNQPQAAARTTVKGLMCQVDVKKRFEDILG